MKVLIVGGEFNGEGGSMSAFTNELLHEFRSKMSITDCVDCVNGGLSSHIKSIYEWSRIYDVVLWLTDLEYFYKRITPHIKEVNPNVVLVTLAQSVSSSFDHSDELVFRLAQSYSLLDRAVLTLATGKTILLFDSDGKKYYKGPDLSGCVNMLFEVIKNLSKEKAECSSLHSSETVPNDPEYFAVVNNLMKKTQELLPNSSELKYSLCYKKNLPLLLGCASFRDCDKVFVSAKHMDHSPISETFFISVGLNHQDIQNKALQSVLYSDIPFFLPFYMILPNINYMFHCHSYIEGAPFANSIVNYGEGHIEETKEMLNTLISHYKSLDEPFYAVNLDQHGSIVMGQTPADIKDVRFIKRDRTYICADSGQFFD